jgi:hypothetical protein
MMAAAAALQRNGCQLSGCAAWCRSLQMANDAQPYCIVDAMMVCLRMMLRSSIGFKQLNQLSDSP